MSEAEEIDWPTEEGIWMAYLEEMGCWFPLKARLLKKYAPGVPHLPMPIVAQWPESIQRWPYTFQRCHPAKRWRRPTEEEMAKARNFYGEETPS
ncbi:MAG TPA: hypothetical protein VGM54_10085 [Chthoniobacter sp.]|jgi:hypothetical protein